MAQAVTPPEVLDLVIPECDIGKNVTVRRYLMELLAELWREKESFSGKRPFGNGGWEFCIYESLIAGGLVSGQLDDYGCVSTIDSEHADRLIADAIQSMKAKP